MGGWVGGCGGLHTVTAEQPDPTSELLPDLGPLAPGRENAHQSSKLCASLSAGP